jgi:glycolate oxidase FAD binding subunit
VSEYPIWVAAASDMSTTPESILERVRQARDGGKTLSIRGGDTKCRLGRRATGDEDLLVSGVDQLISYEPGELILVARPGIRLTVLEEMLAKENQHLPFEPPHWGDAATLGGTVACNLSGPRRFRAGAARDFLLGLEMIDGHGQRVRAGGRVVKNVTGYDLCKVLCGSFGTLGVLTELCLKVWPRPETQKTMVWHRHDCDTAIDRMLDAVASPCEVTALAYLPATADGEARTMARLEGPAPAVAAQAETLAARYGGDVESLDGPDSVNAWRDLRELSSARPLPHQQLWRFSGAATNARELVEKMKEHRLETFVLDWGGALLWALFPASVAATDLHDEAARCKATAWRIAGSCEEDNDLAFSPLSAGVARLNSAVKRSFDPLGLFNPGRLYP